MTWTHFHDMHSGGGQKLAWGHLFIEAPKDEARSVFYARFGRSPDRVTCTCCGADYSLTESPTLERATGYNRGLRRLETPKASRGRYVRVDDPYFHEHYYLEPGEEPKPPYTEEDSALNFYRMRDGGQGLTLAEYVAKPDVLVVYAADIKPEERTAHVPQEGYVWEGEDE